MSFYIKSFCIVNIMTIFIKANINASNAIGRSDVVLKGELIKKLFYTFIIILVLFYGKTPKMFAIAMIVITFIEALINASFNRRIIDYGFIRQIKDVLPNLIISIIMGFIVFFIDYLFINKLISLIIQVLSGIIIYILLSIITKNDNYYYLIDYIKKRLKKEK